MKNDMFKTDLYRYYGGKESFRQRLLRPRELSYIRMLRKARAAKNPIAKVWYRLRLRRISAKTMIQIPHATEIGAGFYIGHCGAVVINPCAVIGKNVNIAAGVTVGQENRGKRKGTPRIGNEVWIGTNAVVVGNITVGDDVLIAPLTFVNFDVPSHSVVIGNPARIIPREHATEGYIQNKVD